MNIYKPNRTKRDRYQKFNKSSMTIRESSFLSNSIETNATINLDASGQAKECRICLHEEDPMGVRQLHSPCKCQGSVKFLHKHCFISWVNRLLEMKPIQDCEKIIEDGCECQICKFLVPIKSDRELLCSSKQLIKNRIKRRPFMFSVFVIIQVVCMIVMGFVIGAMVSLGIKFDDANVVVSVVMVCSVVVLFYLLLGVFYFCVSDYLLSEKIVALDFAAKHYIFQPIQPDLQQPLSPQPTSFSPSKIISVNSSAHKLQE